MLLVIDNYDSFVHNLARYLRQLGHDVRVERNDSEALSRIEMLRPDAIVISPGPGTPMQAGRCLDIVRHWSDRIPMLGVCLGHQVLAEEFGARVVRACEPVHVRASSIQHSGRGIFAGLPNPLHVGRYHSLVVDGATLPEVLHPLAHTQDGTLMAFEHRQLPLVGLQFHPESVLTQFGDRILAGFLRHAGLAVTV
jgi:anthranilate synthase/aminodeoxychorismate synthase-like glutamine amidotransferase